MYENVPVLSHWMCSQKYKSSQAPIVTGSIFLNSTNTSTLYYRETLAVWPHVGNRLCLERDCTCLCSMRGT